MTTISKSPDRHCIHCGRAEGEANPDDDNRPTRFASAFKLKCERCDAKVVEDRKEYHRLYHLARNAALARLLALHGDEFNRMMDEEWARVQEERPERVKGRGTS